MTVRLEELLANATAWDDSASYYEQQRVIDAQRELRKLAPDAVRLLIDTTKALRDVVEGSMWECPFCGRNMEHDGHKDECEYAALLARLDRLGNTT